MNCFTSELNSTLLNVRRTEGTSASSMKGTVVDSRIAGMHLVSTSIFQVSLSGGISLFDNGITIPFFSSRDFNKPGLCRPQTKQLTSELAHQILSSELNKFKLPPVVFIALICTTSMSVALKNNLEMITNRIQNN